MPLNPGDTLLNGQYRILRLLEQAGSGFVYRAHDTLLGEDVAIKELRADLVGDEAKLRAITHLGHKRIVRTYNVFAEGDETYIVMEYLAGDSLEARLEAQGRMLVPEAVRIAVEVCEGLRYAHRHGQVHSDLKPANILFDARGSAKVAYPTAAHAPEQILTCYDGAPGGSVEGTLPYTEPEQVEGVSSDPRADVYALGAVLYRMLTGRTYLTFGEQQTPAARTGNLDRVRRQQPKLPSDYNHRVPAWLDEVVLTALAKRPGDRYDTANELRIALLRHRPARTSAHLPAQVEPRSAQQLGSNVHPRRQRSPLPSWFWLSVAGTLVLLLAITVAAVVLVAGSGGGTAWPVLAGTRIPQPAVPISPESADRVAQLARWGRGTVEQVTYSTDGTWLAVASSMGLYLYDARTLAPIRFLETPDWTYSVAFSPDGETLASGSEDGVVRLWQVTDGTLLATLDGHADRVRSVAFSPGGEMLASGSEDATLRLWDVDDRSLLRTLEGHTGPVWRVAFSPDGGTLASGSSDDTFRLWRLSDGGLLDTLEGHMGGEGAVAFSPDGATLATGWGEAVRLWRLSEGGQTSWETMPPMTLEGHTGWISSLAFSPDGTTLASSSGDLTVRLWDVGEGSQSIETRGSLHTFEGHMSDVLSVAFSPDGTAVASGSDDGTVQRWQVAEATPLEGLTAGEQSLVFSPDGSTLAGGSGDALHLRRVSDGTLIGTLLEHDDWVRGLDFSPDGTLLASASDDRTVRLWRLGDGRPPKGSGQLLNILEGHADAVWSIAFSPDGSMLASGSDDGTVRLWRVSNGRPPEGSDQLLRTLEGHVGRVWSIAFSPNGTMLASGADDGTVRLWRVSDGGLLLTLEGHADSVWSLDFSPDEAMLASGSGDETVRLWRVSEGGQTLRSGELLGTLEGHTYGVTGVAFSPDSTMLAAGDSDATVRLWRIDDRSLMATFAGHRAGIESLAFAPDGSLLASGSYDGTVRLWGITGE